MQLSGHHSFSYVFTSGVLLCSNTTIAFSTNHQNGCKFLFKSNEIAFASYWHIAHTYNANIRHIIPFGQPPSVYRFFFFCATTVYKISLSHIQRVYSAMKHCQYWTVPARWNNDLSMCNFQHWTFVASPQATHHAFKLFSLSACGSGKLNGRSYPFHLKCKHKQLVYRWDILCTPVVISTQRWWLCNWYNLHNICSKIQWL